MPLVGFRPTKARLVIEDGRESVFVMKVVLDTEDAVELADGGTLAALTGVLRIRERRNGAGSGGQPIGSMVYVAETGAEPGTGTARFQVNVAMAADKFAMLLRTASTGRLPTKFFVDAGGRAKGGATPLGYRVRSGVRMKVWDNHASPSLPVTNFVMILPIELPVPVNGAAAASDPVLPVAATNAQVAELMDDMLVFQSDTRNMMFGLLSVLAIVAIAALAIGLALYFR
jgi:hypothetical protein